MEIPEFIDETSKIEITFSVFVINIGYISILPPDIKFKLAFAINAST